MSALPRPDLPPGPHREFHALWLSASSPTLEPPAPRIAGRRAELDVVRRHLDTGAGLLLVTGEGGIGKTTVLQTGAAAGQLSSTVRISISSS